MYNSHDDAYSKSTLALTLHVHIVGYIRCIHSFSRGQTWPQPTLTTLIDEKYYNELLQCICAKGCAYAKVFRRGNVAKILLLRYTIFRRRRFIGVFITFPVWFMACSIPHIFMISFNLQNAFSIIGYLAKFVGVWRGVYTLKCQSGFATVLKP